jgi:hypothetical protein
MAQGKACRGYTAGKAIVLMSARAAACGHGNPGPDGATGNPAREAPGQPDWAAQHPDQETVSGVFRLAGGDAYQVEIVDYH